MALLEEHALAFDQIPIPDDVTFFREAFTTGMTKIDPLVPFVVHVKVMYADSHTDEWHQLYTKERLVSSVQAGVHKLLSWDDKLNQPGINVAYCTVYHPTGQKKQFIPDVQRGVHFPAGTYTGEYPEFNPSTTEDLRDVYSGAEPLRRIGDELPVNVVDTTGTSQLPGLLSGLRK